MDFISWILTGVGVGILIAGIVASLVTRKKVKDMNGFRGITKRADTKGKIE